MKLFAWKSFLVGGLFVAAQAIALPAHAGPSLCNGAPNGILDGNEQCETGPCCTAKCELKSAATVCRASTDQVCDPAETCGEQAAAVDAACPADVLADDGTSCDDGQFCTADDACAAGVCTGGTGDPCDDDDSCTADTCDEKRNSCSHSAADDGTACDDGSACTTDDVCTGGSCGGTAVVCDDGNVCTDDSCDEETGACTTTNNTASCDDGQFCTSDDVCADGVCVGGGATDCDDGDACTNDACDAEAGACTHGAAADGTACDDGQFCTVGDACSAGVCVGGGANDCNDDNSCTTDECSEASNSCKHGRAPNGNACDDGSACTTDDVCSNGVCVGGAPLVCDDDNLCTTDLCNGETGCVFTPNTIPCNDGLFCTTGDRCSDGACVGGTAPNCDDGNVCTVDSCDEETDSCTNAPGDDGVACDDGKLCTINDSCKAGACVGGDTNPCDDEIDCTLDSCNVGLDECKHTPKNGGEPCEDGSFCTVGDSCHAGACIGTARNCSDDNVCTTDSCSEIADVCEHVNNTDPCDDGLFCTIGDTCSGGTCSVNTPNCNDNNVCTTDSCDEAADTCSNVNNTAPCEDGLFCTAGDTCAAGACVPGPAKDCNDNNVCTTDSCNEAADTCDNVNNILPCDDGLFCTDGDVCSAGACVPGPARNCADTNPCTTDTCDETANACSNVNNTNPCDDGLFCTLGDTCAGGICVGGPANTCTDNNVCTNDTCNEDTNACDHVNNTLACDDGLFCTNGDTCVDGACVPGPARNCGDANPCTDDACNETTNSCDNLANTLPCDDGLFCTNGDACSGGSCVPGAARSCNDSDPCTTDSCNEATNQCDNVAIPNCVATTTTTLAGCPVCGNYFDDDCILTASDALGVLQAAVGLHECCLSVCDFSGDGQITALDALAVLRAAVGLPNDPSCPEECGTTTTLP